MFSMHEKIISSYPQLFMIVIIILCHMYHISYAYAIGYIMNVGVNYCLKIGFRGLIGDAGNRPIPYSFPYPIQINSFMGRATTYGFPSGHAQSVGYFLAFAHQFLPWRSWHPGWIVAALIAAAWLMHTRIAFRRHTPIQVLFGFVFGIMVFRLIRWLIRWLIRSVP